MKFKVYPDTNIYLRPFDNWDHLKIALEGEASTHEARLYLRLAKQYLFYQNKIEKRAEQYVSKFYC